MAGRSYLFKRQQTTAQTNVSKNEVCQTTSKEPDELPKLQGMAGRGYFLKQLRQTTAKEPETSLKSQSNDITAKSSVPKITNGYQPQVCQGRRRLFAQLELMSLEQRNSKDLACPPIIKNDKIHRVLDSTTLPQLQSMTNPQQPIIELPKEQKDPIICRVPKHSEKGNYCTTESSSNYIKIELEESKSLYEYVVDFNPPVDNKSAQLYLINRCKEFPVKTFHNNLLFIPHILPQNKTILTGELKDGSEVKITITYKRKQNVSERITFYSILLRSIMKMLDFVEFGRYFYDKNKKIVIPQYKLEVWPGYIVNVDEFENGLYMCCDISHRVLNTETVLEKIEETVYYSKQNNTDFKQEIMALLCSRVVITRYNNKTYRVDDIEFSMTPLSTFKYHDSEISFVDYLKKNYDVEIKKHNQPMLVVMPKNNNILSKKGLEDSSICCLVPELCNLTGLTDNMKSDFKLMKALNNRASLTPNKRIDGMIALMNSINDHEGAKNKLKNWGLKLCLTPEKIEGPVYKNETILLGQQLRKQIGINMDWGMDVAKSAMFRAVNMSNWVIFYNSRDFSTAKSFSHNLNMYAQPMGMNISKPLSIQVGGINVEAFVSEINCAVRRNPNLQLIVIIFPNQREDRYNAVKRLCCTDLGIPSQVIVSRTLSKPDRLRSITQKIALQINCKLGGACWSIDIPLKNTMIVGIDVYHEKDKQHHSVVGLVASMDTTFTQWCSVSTIQKNTQQEMMDSFPTSFNKVLNKYKEKNGMLPSRIIIYRDGVSDGDLLHVEQIELCGLENLFKSYPGNYSPMITFIVVQKRIHTRIFQILNENYSNPKSGTVVDNTITRRNYFDFFLVSQHVRQGTVTPTHYIVLKNGCNLSPEKIQRLSYKLCHMYYNWTGTIKVPAPVQYAHKLAFLVGQNIRKLPSDKLTETLFFL